MMHPIIKIEIPLSGGAFYVALPWSRFAERGTRNIDIPLGNVENVPYSVHTIHNFHSTSGYWQTDENRYPLLMGGVTLYTELGVEVPLIEGGTVPLGNCRIAHLRLSSPGIYSPATEELKQDFFNHGFTYLVFAPTVFFPGVLSQSKRGANWQIEDIRIHFTGPIVECSIFGDPSHMLATVKGAPKFRVVSIDRIQISAKMRREAQTKFFDFSTVELFTKSYTPGNNDFHFFRHHFFSSSGFVLEEEAFAGYYADDQRFTFDPPVKLFYSVEDEAAQLGCGFPFIRLTHNGELFQENEFWWCVSGRFENYGENFCDLTP